MLEHEQEFKFKMLEQRHNEKIRRWQKTNSEYQNLKEHTEDSKQTSLTVQTSNQINKFVSRILSCYVNLPDKKDQSCKDKLEQIEKEIAIADTSIREWQGEEFFAEVKNNVKSQMAGERKQIYIQE